MEDTTTKQEIMRLMAPGMGRRLTLARWENVYFLYEQGKSLIEIGKWIGKAESTVRQLLKRAALERQKRPGFIWPMDARGRNICDIPHPMPSTENPQQWVHVRAATISPTKRACYCAVCRKGGILNAPAVYKGALTDSEIRKRKSTFFLPYEIIEPEVTVPVTKTREGERASDG